MKQKIFYKVESYNGLLGYDKNKPLKLIKKYDEKRDTETIILKEII